ncbi:hypothetical protein [Leifsonia sp. NCR5]|uniref:hypothetical protein n=1 Tax=Leifsonia sp. NCR5 TaxID=1978342 RepID=UPI000A18DFF0|nr:hypothetical protein [Leifsonia sp. NCR5]
MKPSPTLEDRYRRALRWYPPLWRARTESAMLGTLLERAEDESRTEPARGELADLRVNGLLQRMNAVVTIVPADGRRAVSSAALGLGAGFSLFFLVVFELDPLRVVGPADYGMRTFGPVLTPGVVVYALWLAAFLFAAFDWDRTARILLAASMAASALLYPVAGAAFRTHLAGPDPASTVAISFLPAPATLLFLGVIAVVGMLSRAPMPSRPAALWAFGITALALVAITLTNLVRTNMLRFDDAWLWRDERGLAVAIGILLVVAMILRRRAGAAATACTAIAALLFGMLAVTLAVAKADSPGVNAVIAIAGAAVVTLAVVVVAIVAFRRRLARSGASGRADWEA